MGQDIECCKTLQVCSPQQLETKAGEIIYISAILQNKSEKTSAYRLGLELPAGWQDVSVEGKEITLFPNDSKVQIVAVKVPVETLAKEYLLALVLEGQGGIERQTLSVSILPNSSFLLEWVDRAAFYPFDEAADLTLKFTNRGNIPLFIELEASTDPACPLYYPREVTEILPFDSQFLTLRVIPRLEFGLDKQFILLKVSNQQTGEILIRETLSLRLTPQTIADDDLYVRIPSQVTFLALGDNAKHVFAIEFTGEGAIDTQGKRFLEYDFLLPTDSRNVIYGVEQRLFVGLSDPDWELLLGDTVYVLTPLTQGARYGRGAGFDLYKKRWAAGAHYTQNTFKNDYDPKDTCGYVELDPTPSVSLSLNYLGKRLKKIPSANILTLASEIEFPSRVFTEIECGKNFSGNFRKNNKSAYRIASRGKLLNDTWFDFERIYTGQAFCGYYDPTNLYSLTADFPVWRNLRANCSYNQFKNFYGHEAASPWQHQFNLNLDYNFSAGKNLSFNGLLLRSKDMGSACQYNFYQKWAGLTFSYAKKNYSLSGLASFGTQEDRRMRNKTSFLQKYYAFFTKNLGNNSSCTFFYEGGNTNYYDVHAWRTTFGGSLRLAYRSQSWIELFLQHVKNSPEQFELSQVSVNYNHVRKNRHLVQLSVQYFHYKRYYNDDFLFLCSYQIPFGLPVCKKTDRGVLEGTIYDVWDNCPVPSATLNLNGKQTVTDSAGRFAFPKAPVGQHQLITEILPKNLITQDLPAKVEVLGGKENRVAIHVVPACLIQGSIILYRQDESIPIHHRIESLSDPQLVESQKMSGMRVFIDRDHGKEIYSCLTDKNGRFYFANLRPGVWRVSMSTEELPPLHNFRLSEMVIEMKPAEEKELTFHIIPEIRTLKPVL